MVGKDAAVVTMSNIWDRSVAAVRGRPGAFAAIVLPLVWLPGVVQQGVRLALVGPAPAASAVSPGAAALVALLGLASVVLALLGLLAATVLAGDPATSARAALLVAARRLPVALGIALILVLALLLLMLPMLVPVLAAYPDMAAMQAGATPDLSPGAGAFVTLYGIALVAAFVWLEARVTIVLWPVVLGERLGLAALRRAVGLTRGLTWRLVGALLLFGLVVGVGFVALWSVSGTFWWLVLGGGRPALAQFLLSATVSLLTTGAATMVAAFSAQLYLARAGDVAAPAVPPGAPGAPAPVREGPWG